MDGRSILLALVPVGLTLVNYAIIRDLLWGILLGSKSKEAAEKIRNSAEGFHRFSQSYIGPHLTKYQSDFKKWMTLKVITLILTIVQIIAFAVMIALRVEFWIVGIICAAIVIFDVVLFGMMMTNTQSSTDANNTKGSPWKFEQGGKKAIRNNQKNKGNKRKKG